MKRLSIALLLLLATAAVAWAATAITVNPSEMKNGETKTLVDGQKSITVRRDGDDVHIKIEGGGAMHSLTITRSGDNFRIERGLDGLLIEPRANVFRWRAPAAQTWFVCPNDHTVLRVPKGEEDRVYKCPIDGARMEKRKSLGFGFLFDDDADSL